MAGGRCLRRAACIPTGGAEGISETENSAGQSTHRRQGAIGSLPLLRQAVVGEWNHFLCHLPSSGTGLYGRQGACSRRHGANSSTKLNEPDECGVCRGIQLEQPGRPFAGGTGAEADVRDRPRGVGRGQGRSAKADPLGPGLPRSVSASIRRRSQSVPHRQRHEGPGFVRTHDSLRWVAI